MKHMPNRPNNVILITLDSLGAGDMSLYGHERLTTPHLDAFAGRSYVFDFMIANSNSSAPAIASIFTGTLPLTHRVRNALPLAPLLSGLPFPGGERSLFRVLADKGYQTMAAVGLKYLSFICRDLSKPRCPEMKPVFRPDRGSLFPAARHMSSHAQRLCLDAVSLVQTARAPFFLWLHSYPPHAPYLPVPRFRDTFLSSQEFGTSGSQLPFLYRFYERSLQPRVDLLRARYNELILEADHAVGSFLIWLQETGLDEKTLVIITADHGEMFERGYQGHDGPLLYQPLLRIPLIIRLPGQKEGRRISVDAEQRDIAPTILDLLGCEVPVWMEGASLAEPMQGGTGSDRAKFSVSVLSQASRPLGCVSVIKDGFKLIHDLGERTDELYNLACDPKETQDIAQDRGPVVKELKRLVLREMGAV